MKIDAKHLQFTNPAHPTQTRTRKIYIGINKRMSFSFACISQCAIARKHSIPMDVSNPHGATKPKSIRTWKWTLEREFLKSSSKILVPGPSFPSLVFVPCTGSRGSIPAPCPVPGPDSRPGSGPWSLMSDFRCPCLQKFPRMHVYGTLRMLETCWKHAGNMLET